MPIAKPDSARTLRGAPVVIAVLANDEGTDLAVVGYTQPPFGGLALNADGSFTYTPAAGFEGTDGFAYTVRDRLGVTAQGEVQVVVARPNTAPEPQGDGAEAVAGDGDGVVIPVLANDNDPEGDPLAIIGIDAPAHGTIRVLADQSVRYTPQPGFDGVDSFTYTVFDGQGAAGTANVTVTVALPNLPPLAVADRATTVEGTPVTVDALANDNDPEGGPLSLTGMTLPPHGSLTLTPEHAFVYEPDAGFVGEDSFTYQVRDVEGATATATVTVDVTTQNSPPVAMPDLAASSGAPVTVDPLANDSDPDGDPLRLTALTLPVDGEIALDPDGRRVTYTPPAGFSGTGSFTYQVSDGTAVSEAEVRLTVTAPAVPTYANGYRQRRRLVAPPQAAAAEVATDFVLLVREAGAWLKPVANGGKVAHAQGFDLRFELEDGTKLDHEVERYDAGAGSLIAWVRVPSWQLAAQVRLYLYYGKPGLTATEANPTAVWRGYLAVLDARTGADRSGGGRALAPSGVAAGALLGDAGSYTGASVATRADAAFLSGLGALTVQALVAPDAATVGSSHGILAQGPMNGTDASAGLALQFLPQTADGVRNVIHFKVNCSDGAASVLSGADAQRAGRQLLHGVWRQGAVAKLFLDGQELPTSAAPAPRAGATAMPAGGLYLGAGARDPATGGWIGLIDEVRFAAAAFSPARIASEAANLGATQTLYGLGGEDAAGDADAAPVAVPVRAVAAAGSSVDLDVAAAAYDPDGPQPLSVSAVGAPRNGVVTVVSGKVRYTPFAGFVGSDDFTYTVQSGTKRSTGVVVVTVPAPATTLELPAARRTINVTSATQLTAALAGNFAGLSTSPANAAGPLAAGDHVVLGDATYGGSFTLGRSGTAPTNGNRSGVPIVVRASNPLGARFTGKFNVSGVNGWLYGLDFDGQNQNAAIGSTLGGDHSRLMRCRFRRHRTAADQAGGAIVVMVAAKYNKIWYCEFADFDGRPISSKTTESPALYPHIYRCHWRNNVAPPAGSDGNARECLQLGQTQGNGAPVRTPMRGLVEYNLIKDLYVGAGHDESEPFSNKSSNNIYRYNSFDNIKNYLTIRFGLDCEVYANHFNNAGGIVVYGDNHRIIGNAIVGTANARRIRLFSGTQTMELDPGHQHPNGPTAPDAGNMVGFTPWGGKADPDKADEPTCRDVFLSGNSGTLLVGEMPREYARLRCTGIVIEQHSGTILTERGYTSWGGRAHTAKGSAFASDGHREHGTAYRATATVDLPVANPLAATQVGPAAPWIAPSLWPATLP